MPHMLASSLKRAIEVGRTNLLSAQFAVLDYVLCTCQVLERHRNWGFKLLSNKRAPVIHGCPRAEETCA